MAYTPSTTHTADGLARLVDQLRDQPRLRELAGAYLDQVQEVEDALAQVYLYRWADTAEGAQLDLLGRIVGEPRLGRTDAEYRTWLLVRRRINRCMGTADEILSLMSLIVTDAAVEIEDQPPATMVLRTGLTATDPDAVVGILQETRAAGVRALYEYETVPSTESFGFSGSDGAGFGDGTFTTVTEA